MGINWGDIGSKITDIGGKVGETLISPSPIVKLVTNPQKAWEDPSTLLPDTVRSLGNGGPVRSVDEQWKEVGEDYVNRVKDNVDLLISPNPVLSIATGNGGDIINLDKTAQEKWENVTETTKETVDQTIVQPVVKETEKIKETVKETVNNVTKGVGEALPIIAIGGAAVLVVSLLLGRR